MKRKFSLLDCAQCFAALLVVLVHCGRLAENDLVHFLLKSLLCRWAVPFFLVLNGYFFRKKQYLLKEWILRQLKIYILWSIIYLPYGMMYLQQLALPVYFYPVAFGFAFFMIGICYHLWYFPALISGMWLVHKTRKWGYPIQFGLASFLYVIGSSETYSSYLEGPLLTFYDIYKSLFLTTRNGLFYSFIFLLCGTFLADYQKHSIFQNHLRKKIALLLLFLLIEGGIFYINQGDDKNFLLMMVPVALFMTAFLVKNSKIQSSQSSLLRQGSRAFFFIHPFVLESGKTIASLHGIPLFVFTVLGVSGLVAVKVNLVKIIDTLYQAEYGEW
ncbi:acyltransferase family protein [Enterococcus gallinarum]|uniref:acyltransferase family protein n=1 Tax=Enterococcus gallinarum TaxID=1353 RepID=UPI0012E2AB12|nr:acyltransferase family protein [Enterococcus gallinarum]MUO31981.1 acyltransferase family protein [Enterococcus gallinarum]